MTWVSNKIEREKNDFAVWRETDWPRSICTRQDDQSNISFAYYLLKPENSGNISFLVEPPPNEFAAGLLHEEKIKIGLLKNFSKRNAPTVDIHTKEDDIVIFPSKTKHATLPNTSDNPRISISGDISIMLKESFGHERLMPHYNNWQSF